MDEQEMIPREEVTKVLNTAYNELSLDLKEAVKQNSLRGMALSSQMFVVEVIAKQLHIELSKEDV